MNIRKLYNLVTQTPPDKIWNTVLTETPELVWNEAFSKAILTSIQIQESDPFRGPAQQKRYFNDYNFFTSLYDAKIISDDDYRLYVHIMTDNEENFKIWANENSRSRGSHRILYII